MIREKYCEIFKTSFPKMFRIQYKPNKTWVFTRECCLVSVKQNKPNYKYGGTWKK